MSDTNNPEQNTKKLPGWLRIILAVVVIAAIVGVIGFLIFIRPESITNTKQEVVVSTVSSPVDGLQTLLKVPVAVQSFHTENISRVELWVTHETTTAKLERADVPDDEGQLLQLWTPLQEGAYTVKVIAVDDKNKQTVVDEREITVVNSPAVRLPVPGEELPAPEPNSIAENPKLMEIIPEPLAQGFDPPALAPPDNRCDAGASRKMTVEVRDKDNNLLLIDSSVETPYEVKTDDKLTLSVQTNPDVDLSVTIYPPYVQVPDENLQIIPEPIPVSNVEPNKPFVFPAKSTGVHIVRIEATSGGCADVQDVYVRVQGDIKTPVAPPPTPTPTPTPFYPPPPPAPGVPGAPQPCHPPCAKSPSSPAPNASSGLLQENLPELMPPTCNAAEYVGVYIPPDTSQRVLITEPDMIPAKTVGGTVVNRAWSIQNIGTCTWGPGYELAFYGGRSMGSGGVAFESFFPNEPARRNIIVNGEQLISPEGKPNEIANLELTLVAPVTPGIHQSYWRMRNPQGVYFGPIVGVTLEVVRDCSFGNYGAPVINKFEILGVGNVYQPDNPVNVDAILGQPVTLDWSISNAQGYDIVVKGPTGGTQNISTGNTTDRASFVPSELGEYTVSLYADNSPCTAVAVVYVDVKPPTDSDTFFVVSVADVASTDGVINVTWKRETDDADEYKLVAQRFERRKDQEDCSFVWESGLLPTYKCEPAWGEWQPSTGSVVLPEELIGVQGQGLPAEVTGGPGEIQSASITVSGNGQPQTFNQGQQTSAQRTVGNQTNSEASVNVTNIVWGLCPSGYNPDDPNNTVQYGIKYKMAALENGQLLESHPFSVPDDKLCGATPATFNTEIIENATSSGGTEFNPER